jgi:hypothetical protein
MPPYRRQVLAAVLCRFAGERKVILLLSLQGFPQIKGLVKTGFDAIARSAVQIDAYVQPPVLRFSHEGFDPVHLLLIDFHGLLRRDPPGRVEFDVVRVGHRHHGVFSIRSMGIRVGSLPIVLQALA